jgi:hypothetical protein
MKKYMAGFAIFLAATIASRGQAIPTATSDTPRYNPGPSLPMIDGNLQYAVSGSEGIVTGFNGNSGLGYTTNLSGDVEYLSPSAVHPFTFLYAGGVLISNYGNASTSAYQSFALSQGLVGHGWALGVSDSFSFLPQSPTTGLSGIPGAGDLGLQPISDPLVPGQFILTNYEKRIANTASVNIERQLTHRLSLNGTGSYGILRFLGDDPQGLNSTQVSGQGGFNYLLNRRSSMGASVQYSSFTYDTNATAFNTRGFSAQYQRQLTKTIGMQLSAGPQWTNGFEAVPVTGGSIATIPVPSRLGVQTSASVSVALKTVSMALSYNHGVNNGSGVQTGATSDSFSLSASRSYGRLWSTSLSGAYYRSSGLVDNNITTAIFGGAQVNRRLTNTLSAFFSYSGIHQDANTSLISRNAFNGFSQSFSLGITFAPRMTRLGQF